LGDIAVEVCALQPSASFLTKARKQDQDGTQFHSDPASKLSANLYDIYHCCVYSKKLLMMYRGTVRNM